MVIYCFEKPPQSTYDTPSSKLSTYQGHYCQKHPLHHLTTHCSGACILASSLLKGYVFILSHQEHLIDTQINTC